MSLEKIAIRPEQVEDALAVENLTKTVFGPGMYARAASVLREGVSHEPRLSFVEQGEGGIRGSVRLTKVNWGDQPAWLLGPLGVLPQYKNKGIGKALLAKSVEAARELALEGKPKLILLVGDHAYYAPFGFQRVAPHLISLPRPADPARILACELTDHALEGFSGPVTRALGG